MINIIKIKLREIANSLMTISQDKYGFEGYRGYAMFLLSYYQYTNDEQYYNKAISFIEKELVHYSNNLNNMSFWTGMSGLGWFCNTFVKKYIDSDYDSGIESLNDYMESIMLNDMRNGQYYYDYLHGGLGIAQYFISCNRFDSLSLLVDKLEQTAIFDFETKGLKWKTNTKHIDGGVDYNLSLSHGMSSIIVILSKIYKLGIQQEKCKKMLKCCINYVSAQSMPKNQFNSMFCSLVTDDNKYYDSRLAWCYGDLCIAIALWHAYDALEEKDYLELLKHILHNTSKRINYDETKIIDASFCHGSSGLAYIFKKMYKFTNVIDCEYASKYWLDITLKMSNHKSFSAGYAFLNGDREYISDYGLLNGISGVGLSLLSFIVDDFQEWDKCLLLS